MTVHSCCAIEFVGGPLDGHTEVKEAPFAPYVGVRTIVARRRPLRVTRMLRKAWRLWRARAGRELVPLAVYELDDDEDKSQPCYRYIATQAVRQDRVGAEQARLTVLVRFAAAST